jgi:hypothetical protein
MYMSIYVNASVVSNTFTYIPLCIHTCAAGEDEDAWDGDESGSRTPSVSVSAPLKALANLTNEGSAASDVEQLANSVTQGVSQLGGAVWGLWSKLDLQVKGDADSETPSAQAMGEEEEEKEREEPQAEEMGEAQAAETEVPETATSVQASTHTHTHTHSPETDISPPVVLSPVPSLESADTTPATTSSSPCSANANNPTPPSQDTAAAAAPSSPSTTSLEQKREGEQEQVDEREPEGVDALPPSIPAQQQADTHTPRLEETPGGVVGDDDFRWDDDATHTHTHTSVVSAATATPSVAADDADAEGQGEEALLEGDDDEDWSWD